MNGGKDLRKCMACLRLCGSSEAFLSGRCWTCVIFNANLTDGDRRYLRSVRISADIATTHSTHSAVRDEGR